MTLTAKEFVTSQILSGRYCISTRFKPTIPSLLPSFTNSANFRKDSRLITVVVCGSYQFEVLFFVCVFPERDSLGLGIRFI